MIYKNIFNECQVFNDQFDAKRILIEIYNDKTKRSPRTLNPIR